MFNYTKYSKDDRLTNSIVINGQFHLFNSTQKLAHHMVKVSDIILNKSANEPY